MSVPAAWGALSFLHFPQWELTAPRHVCRSLGLAGTPCCPPSFGLMCLFTLACRGLCLFLLSVGHVSGHSLAFFFQCTWGCWCLLRACRRKGLCDPQGGTEHLWALDVGRSQTLRPRKFLSLAAGVDSEVLEQGQEERCSGCSSAMACFILLIHPERELQARCSLCLSSRAGWGGWPGTGPLGPPKGNSAVSHGSGRGLKVQAMFRRIIFMARFRS